MLAGLLPGKVQTKVYKCSLDRRIVMSSLVTALLLSGCTKQMRPVIRSDLLTERSGNKRPIDSARPTQQFKVSSKDEWRVYCSSTYTSSVVHDENLDSVLITPEGHGNDLWIMIDLGQSYRFQTIEQIHAGQGEPRRYRIDIAGESGFPWTRVWAGRGEKDRSVAVLQHAYEARFVRIMVLEEGRERWTVSELEIH